MTTGQDCYWAASAIAALLPGEPWSTPPSHRADRRRRTSNAPTQQLDTSASDEPRSVSAEPTTDLPILYVTAVEVILNRDRASGSTSCGSTGSGGPPRAGVSPQLVPTSARYFFGRHT